MDFKKLFKKNDKAVSPVIGVILMVAITVILAAAIGSSVFGQGTTQSAPQANLDIKAVSAYGSTGSAAVVTIEHLGGDSINLAEAATKIMISVGSGVSQQAAPIVSTSTGFTAATDNPIDISVGDVKKLQLMDNAATPAAINTITKGSIVHIKFIDSTTNQIICDKDVRF